MNWDGKIPRRRYALFTHVIHGLKLVVIKENDIERAETWGGFVRWVGKERPAESRKVQKKAA